MSKKNDSQRKDREEKFEEIFQSWLERKNIELKKRREEETRTQQLAMEREAVRIEGGRRAYHRWLQKKNTEDELLAKEKMRQREIRRVKANEKSKQEALAWETFKNWKDQKDTEKKLQLQNNQELVDLSRPPTRASTPTLPGYCSVWLCDLELGCYMLDQVDRPLAYSLLETQQYTDSHDPA